MELYKNAEDVHHVLYCMTEKIRYTTNELGSACFITILKGGNFTASKIIQHLNLTTMDDVVFDYLGLSSYEHGTVSSKHVEVTYPLELTENEVGDRIVWLIDDIKDTGLTLWVAEKIVRKKYPRATVRTAVLINKPNAHAEHVPVYTPDIIGFNYTGDDFLIGCGLGYGEKYRGLQSLYTIKEGEEV